MRILFCHPNYPAQFRRLAPALAQQGHEIVFLHKNIEWHADKDKNVKKYSYKPSRLSSSSQGSLHPYLGRFEDAVLEGQAAAREAIRIKESGFSPDVIISHAGFGNGLYLKDVFPEARRIGFFEWYYTSTEGGDVHFLHSLHGQKVPLDRAMRLRTWNAVTLLELVQCDACVVPTEFQLCNSQKLIVRSFRLFMKVLKRVLCNTYAHCHPFHPGHLAYQMIQIYV